MKTAEELRKHRSKKELANPHGVPSSTLRKPADSKYAEVFSITYSRGWMRPRIIGE